MKAPYIRDEKIAYLAEKTLYDFYGKEPSTIAPPISVEDILEFQLGLHLEMNDLHGKYQAHVDGALYNDDNKVVIDYSLDPIKFPEKENRYRFTMGHEGGHRVVHAPLLYRNPDQLLLLAPPQNYICRKSKSKDPMEKQADKFSANLLMPRDLVINFWMKMQSGKTKDILSEVWNVHRMAREFSVSVQAMTIRLEQLNLTSKQQDKPLFNQS